LGFFTFSSGVFLGLNYSPCSLLPPHSFLLVWNTPAGGPKIASFWSFLSNPHDCPPSLTVNETLPPPIPTFSPCAFSAQRTVQNRFPPQVFPPPSDFFPLLPLPNNVFTKSVEVVEPCFPPFHFPIGMSPNVRKDRSSGVLPLCLWVWGFVFFLLFFFFLLFVPRLIAFGLIFSERIYKPRITSALP